MWFIPCDQAFFGRNNFHVIGLFFCSICGAHAFHPPAPKLQKKCTGPATGNGRRVLAMLRSGKHPDSRPPYTVGTPGPLFAHSRIVVDPFPMLPKSSSNGKRGIPLTQGTASSSSAGLSSSQPRVVPPSQRGKRDLTPIPRPIDFLSNYGKPKVPRVRSPSPNPYESAPSLEGPAPAEQVQVREIQPPLSLDPSPSLEGPASGELAQAIDASGESFFASPPRLRHSRLLLPCCRRIMWGI